MIQLWAWEYEGKTEVGQEYLGRLIAITNDKSSGLREKSQVTNLRKVKVVDEDDAVISGVKADDLDFVLEKAVHALPKDSKTQEQLASVRVRLRGVTPPVTEPKNFGAIVEAGNGKHPEHDRCQWVNTKGVNSWTNGFSNNKWSDLINPIIISEGVEG